MLHSHLTPRLCVCADHLRDVLREKKRWNSLKKQHNELKAWLELTVGNKILKPKRLTILARAAAVLGASQLDKTGSTMLQTLAD